MTRPPRSLPDIAEHLMAEFDGRISPSAVTDVVMRLSRNGGMTLDELLELARTELELTLPDAAAPPEGLDRPAVLDGS